jgi:DMSO/TMAO reductase YedYZ heme-binding membrane subunit
MDRRRLSVPTTAGRSRGRQGVRSGTSGAVGEHLSKIMATVATALLVLGFTLVMTKAGRDIDTATQRFMLFYAGVFALIGLTASVGVGLLATDRIIMTPGHRVMAQAVHRAVSFGALAFLIIHIVTEILAQRAHVIDAVVPFLSPYRTFYIGLGTIASDLILLIIVTSIFRKRFTAHGKAWRWRAIHYAAYLAFVFGVLHGLLGGRSAKPYVDWSYGAAIALTALAVVVRFLAISLRPKESLSARPSADRGSGGLGASPLRAASLSLAQAQLGGTIQALPASLSAQAAIGLPGSQPRAALPYASGWASPSGPLPALAAAPAYPAETSYQAYPDPALMPLGAPVYAADPPWPASAGLGPDGRQPRYEPGYDGPPRFEGAPRKHVPQDDVSSYPYGAQSRQPPGGPGTGPIPRVNTGPMPRLPAGPVPRPGTAPRPRADSGPLPRLGTGPTPRADTGPMPRTDSGPMPRVRSGPPRADTGPMPRTDSGPMPRVRSGPPRADTGPMPRAETGPMPRVGSGPMPGFGSGPMPRLGTGSVPRPVPGPAPRPDLRPMPRADSRPMPRVDTGPMPRVDTGPMPRVDTGPMPRVDTGPMPRLGGGPMPGFDSGPLPSANSGPMPRLETGPMPHPGNGTHSHGATRPSRRPSRGTNPYPVAGPMPGADSGLMPRPPARHSRRPDPADPRNRNVSRRTGGTEQG